MLDTICTECGSTEYEMRETNRKYEGDDYSFVIPVNIPFCKVCGNPIDNDDIEEKIATMANQRIREARGIIKTEEIRQILLTYGITCDFLCELLGWEKGTLDKYLSGCTPNMENSNMLRSLEDPCCFKRLLESAGKKNS